MRNVVRFLICALCLWVAAAHAGGCEPKDRPIELKGDDGLLALEIDSTNYVTGVHVERRGSVFGATATGLGDGHVLCLMKLSAGDYRWDRIDVGVMNHFYAQATYIHVPDEPLFRFHVDAGVINYGGDFNLQLVGFMRLAMDVVNRSARMLIALDTQFPGLRTKYPLRYQGSTPDPWLDFASAQLGDTSAQKAYEAGYALHNAEAPNDAAPELKQLVDELFQRAQVSRVRLNSAGDLIAMVEFRKGSNRLSVYDPQAHVAADLYAGDAAVGSIRFADDRTLLYEVGPRGRAANVAHIERHPDKEPTFVKYTVPDAGWFIDAAPGPNGPHATFVRAEGKSLHLYRVALAGERMDRRQFAAALRLDKGLDDVMGGLTDAAGVLRVAITRADGDFVLMYRADAASAWHEVRRIGPNERFEPVLLSAEGDSLVALSDRDRAQTDLVRMALPSGEFKETIYTLPGVDVESALTRDSDRSVLGVSLFRDGQYQTQYLSAPDESARKAIAHALPGKTIALYDTSVDRKRMLILAFDETTAGTFYLFDAAAHTLAEIESVQTPMPHVQPVRSQVIKVSANDGTPLESYLTLPAGRKAPYPLVVVPHGGPIGARDSLDFDPEVQLLAARGYAVLRVNYRGSGGFGNAFEHAGFGAWGKDIEDDILAALDAAEKAAPIDPKRVALRGTSYGGYSTLMGLIRSPERFRCGVAVSGVSDLPLMFSSSDWSHDQRLRAEMAQIVGDPTRGLAALEAVSPDYLYRKLERPLLLVHGGADVRVTPEHALRLLLLLGKAQKPPQVMFFPGEGHGISNKEARYAVEAASEKFLSGCLRDDAVAAQ